MMTIDEVSRTTAKHWCSRCRRFDLDIFGRGRRAWSTGHVVERVLEEILCFFEGAMYRVSESMCRFRPSQGLEVVVVLRQRLASNFE